MYIVKLFQKGSKQAVSFPELTVLSGNIEDVEIISSEKKASDKKATASKAQSQVPKTTQAQAPKTTQAHTASPHATPSVYASKAHTFPTGNARQTLPREEFDFAANLARFDKANEFKKIQAEDLVPKDERLVAINSPQRKLGIHENVLESGKKISIAKKPISPEIVNTSNTSLLSSSTLRQSGSPAPVSVTDEIMEKFKHLAVPSGKSNSKVFVEEGSSSESESDEPRTFDIPMIDTAKFDALFQEKPESFRTISALNFAHHLLAELDTSKSIVLLLGVDESSAILMESFYHLCNHGRLRDAEIHAIFAAGGKGSAGKRIELGAATKLARKRLIALERVKFTTNLADVVKLQNVTVFDALGHDGELTQNAIKGLTEWMKKLLEVSRDEVGKKIIYGIESCILKSKSYDNLQLVTFGMARDTLTPSLPSSKSILYVDAGIPALSETCEIFNESFVTEIEY